MSWSAARFAHLGLRTSRRSGISGAVHRLGLLLATALVVVASALFLMLESAAERRHDRIEAREPVFTSGELVDGVGHWRGFADHLGDRQFTLVYLIPSDDDAAPPPGLPRWPAPGEAFLSPALLDADPTGTIQHRYGTFGGLIGDAGLADANEWFAYVRPFDDRIITETDRRTEISGFGRVVTEEDPGRTTALLEYGPSDLHQLLLWCVGLPAAVLVAVAARIGAEARDRRLALLDAIGAPRRARALFLAGEAVPPVAVGALTGGLVALVPVIWDVTLPVVRYRVWSDDIAPVAGQLPFAVGAGILLVIGVAVASAWRRGPVSQASIRVVARQPRLWPKLVFALALAGSIWTATTAYQRGGVEIGSYLGQAFLLCTGIVLVTTPSVLASAAIPVGRLVAGLGRRSDNVAALVGGRWLHHRWSALARMGAAATIGLSLAALISVTVGNPARAAEGSIVRQQIGTGIITVRDTGGLDSYHELVDAVGAQHALIVVLDEQNQPVLVGHCEAIAQLGEVSSCPSGPAEWDSVIAAAGVLGNALVNGYGTILFAGEPRLSTTAADGTVVGALVLDADLEQSVADVAKAAFATLGIADVHASSQYAVEGEANYARVFLWFILFLAAGMLLLFTSTVLGSLDVFALQARNLGPVGALSSGPRLYLGIASWNIGIAFGLAAAGGGALAMVLSFLFIRLRNTGLPLPWPTVLAGVGIVLVLAAAMTLWCGIVATKAARRWRPVND